MTLSALDLLSTVVATLLSAHSGGLDRLTIHNPRARLRIPLQANPQTFSDSPVDPCPGAIDAPFPEVVVNGGPSRKVVREQAPLTTASQDIEDGVEDLAEAVDSRSTVS